MSDSIVLVCAVLASLTSGVLVAYGVCVALFRVFQMQAEHAAVKATPPVAAAVQVVEG